MKLARIIGERIILREYQKEDLPYIRTWVNDPEITDYLSNVFLYPHTVDGTEKFLNAMLEGNTDMKGWIGNPFLDTILLNIDFV